MATAAAYLADLEAAGIPTHRPEVQQLAARKSFEDVGYDLRAYIIALPTAAQVELVDFLADELGGFYGADLIAKGAAQIGDELSDEAAENARRGNGLS